MRTLTLIILALVLLILQDGILAPLSIVPVNLLLVFMLSTVLISDFNDGLTVALVSGIALDILSGTPDGIITTTMLVIYLVAYFILNSVLTRDPNLFILFSAVAGGSVIYFFIQSLWVGEYVFRNLGLLLLFNLIFTYPIFKIYVWIHSKLKPKVQVE